MGFYLFNFLNQALKWEPIISDFRKNFRKKVRDDITQRGVPNTVNVIFEPKNLSEIFGEPKNLVPRKSL